MYYVWAITFVAGWFGGTWWPGMEKGAPNPKDPQPWFRPSSMVAIAGLAAVAFSRLAPGTDAVAGITVVELVVAIAVGRVSRDFVAPVLER